MSIEKIPKEVLDSLLNKFTSIDARDQYVMQLVDNGTDVPKEYLKETAYHLELKNPEKAAEFYLKADNTKDAIRLYLKMNYIGKATELVEASKDYSELQLYHFYEQHGLFSKALTFALEQENKEKAEFYESLMQYTRR